MPGDKPSAEALHDRFETLYERARSPLSRALERQVCGCDFGGSSWTTREEAERIGDLLRLAPGKRLLDLGAGSGWPGLYLAKISGASACLLDLPLSGLKVARLRSAEEGLDGKAGEGSAYVGSVCGDGAALPLAGQSFDAINHADVLCCLEPKRAVLSECARVLRPGGRMVFSVISLVPGLSPEAEARAVEAGPEFVVAESDYRSLLAQAGWKVVEHWDMTPAYRQTCLRQIEADRVEREGLIDLLGQEEFDERQAGWQATLSVLDEGLLQRERFLAVLA